MARARGDLPATRVLRAQVALGLGHMDYFQGRNAEITARNDELLAWGREEGEAGSCRSALFGHGLAKFECGAFEEAAALAVAAREAAETKASAPLCSSSATSRSSMVTTIGTGALRRRHRGTSTRRRELGLGIMLSLAAGLRILREEFDEARAYASEALSIYRELEDPRGIAWSLDVFAGLIAAEGHAAEAARLWVPRTVCWQLSAARSCRPSAGSGTVTSSRQGPRLAKAHSRRARAEGRAMQPERAIALASRRFDLILGTEHRHRSAPR